jgi:hypothetical protein
MSEPIEGVSTPGFEPAVNAEVQVNAGTEGATPTTPTEEGTPSGQDPTPEGEGQGGTEGTPNPENSGEPNSETPSTTPEADFKEIIDGWKEDRSLLQASEKENQALRDELAQAKAKLSSLGEGDDEEADEFEGLSRAEREAKIIEKHEAKQREAAEKTAKEVADEVRFMERTNKEFRENKAAIIKIAQDFDAKDLEQATKIWKAQKLSADRAVKAAKVEEERKAAAGTAPGGESQGGAPVQGYDPQRDGDKSIKDLLLGK